MAHRLPFLAQRLFNQPLAIHPRKCEVVIGALAERLGIASMTSIDGETAALRPRASWSDYEDDDFRGPGRTPDLGYDLVRGVAVIPICGTLVQKLGSVRPYSGMTGYDGIRAAFLCALEDDAARAIVLEVDSAGGEVAGCFDLVDEIFNARGVKPIHAILDENAYSAAYAIASAADRVLVPRSGGSGSIGIVACHVDMSKALTGAGLTVTLIHYGARKVDGASNEPLSHDALVRFQADIDVLGALFVETVARNRGLAASAVQETEAGTFQGQAGVDAGLADAVMAPVAAFNSLVNTIS